MVCQTMKITILKERQTNEKRVAATPDAVKRFIAAGAKVTLEKNAGLAAGWLDESYKEVGAAIAATPATALKAAEILLCVNAPENIEELPEGILLIGTLNPYANKEKLEKIASKNISAFALELLPRISRAQSMDILSSQANLAGYRAVIEAVSVGAKVVPMMMTAAGTVAPSKVLVLGAGVAGLQAIATAKRLGGVVSAFDVRPVVREQVQSLGAKFIEVPVDKNEAAETTGGYAKEMSEEYKRLQSELIATTAKTQDIIISTALIPGRPAPRLISTEMVESMKQGSIIVDMAAASGGNCELTKLDEVIEHKGVIIVGYSNLPSRCAGDSSSLYARNLFNFISTLMIKDGAITVQWEDELIKGTLLTHEGKIVHPQFLSTSSAA